MNTSRTIKTFVLVAVLLVVTIVPAVIQGNFAHRWGDPPDLIAAAERLNQVPEQFGDWVKESAGRPMTDVEKEILHCYAHNNNSYRNKTTGQRVDIIMTVGPAGPIVRHNPEFCYECRNAIHVGESSMIKVETPEQGENAFREVRFKSPGAMAGEFEIAYAWSDGGRWNRPTSPRIDFGGAPVIFGLQLFGEEMTREESRAAFESFLKEFLPAIRHTVLAPDKSEQAAAQ